MYVEIIRVRRKPFSFVRNFCYFYVVYCTAVRLSWMRFLFQEYIFLCELKRHRTNILGDGSIVSWPLYLFLLFEIIRTIVSWDVWV